MTRLADRDTGHRAGTAEFVRLQRAMLGAALAAFALLYCTQPLLPAIGSDLRADPTGASLTVSASTGALAIAILPLSSLAEAFGRIRLMRLGLIAACVLVLASAAAPNLATLLVLRTLVGVALAAVVAVAMGHVGDEVHPSSVGAAMGVYVAGNSLGGVGGRLVAAAAGDAGSWRWGVCAVGVLGVVATALFSYRIPPAERFRPVPLSWPVLRRSVAGQLRDSGIVRLCLLAFLLMGGFVASYNFLTYRLSHPPFRLSQASIGLIFLAYLAGTATSTVAGRLADRWGRRRVLCGSIAVMGAGLALTAPDRLIAVTAGLLVFTGGFFAAHAVASGWVSRRATRARAQASALYLLAYYAGSSVLGSLTGLAFAHGGWHATVLVVAGYTVLALLLALSMSERHSQEVTT
ncbi:MAG TPA: MFS transporter [Jatrophihabitans sp.]|nr:MFS transporter [Jatrophihabitans sp.]